MKYIESADKQSVVQIKEILCMKLRKKIFSEKFLPDLSNGIEEIRIRINLPVFVKYKGKDINTGIIASKEDINECLEYMSEYSLFSFQEEIKKGYITVRGGHRIGVFGSVISENDKVIGQKNLSFLNIRVAHEIKGCADKIMGFIVRNEKLKHTLIISPPGGGKTTLLRDIIRHLSDGGDFFDNEKMVHFDGCRVCVIDERSEIANCLNGVPQNYLGIRTDVIDACPKSEGMMMAVRAMSPDVVAVDEIGSNKDIEAIEKVINCGCILIGTVHADSFLELDSKTDIKRLLDKKIFKRFILLDNQKNPGQIKEIRELQ